MFFSFIKLKYNCIISPTSFFPPFNSYCARSFPIPFQIYDLFIFSCYCYIHIHTHTQMYKYNLLSPLSVACMFMMISGLTTWFWVTGSFLAKADSLVPACFIARGLFSRVVAYLSLFCMKIILFLCSVCLARICTPFFPC